MAHVDYTGVAKAYRWLECCVFSSTLQKARIHHLNELLESLAGIDTPTIALIGDGDGRFLAELLRSKLEFRIDYIDCSVGMLGLAQERAGGDSRVTWICEEFSKRESSSYDVVVCHFVLDGFALANRECFVRDVIASSKTGGLLVVSDFDSQAHLCAAALVWCMQCFFRVFVGVPSVDVVKPDVLLEGLGLTKIRENCWWNGAIFSQIWKM